MQHQTPEQDQSTLQKINSLNFREHGNRLFTLFKREKNFQLHQVLYCGDSSGVFTYSLKQDSNDKRGMLFASGPGIYAAEALFSYLMLLVCGHDSKSVVHKYLPQGKFESFSMNHGMFIQRSLFTFLKPLKLKQQIKLNWKIEFYDQNRLKFSTEHYKKDNKHVEGAHILKFVSADIVYQRNLLKKSKL